LAGGEEGEQEEEEEGSIIYICEEGSEELVGL
jgi:hypothetical protein